MVPVPAAAAWVEELAAQEGIARVEIWTRAAQQTNADTAEMRSRGKDRLAAGALLVECVRPTDAERIMTMLKTPPAALGIAGASALGTYALLCLYQRAH